MDQVAWDTARMKNELHLAFALRCLGICSRCLRRLLLSSLENFRKDHVGHNPGIRDDLGHSIAKSRVFNTGLIISSQAL